MALSGGIVPRLSGFTFSSGFADLSAKFPGTLSGHGSAVWAIGIGLFTGVFYAISLLLTRKSIRENGASLTSVFGRIGVLVPTLLSIILWKEFPRALQCIGIALAVFSTVLANLDASKIGRTNIKYLLVMMCLAGGTAEFLGKIFQKYALIEFKSFFLAIAYSIAMLCCLVKFKPRVLLGLGALTIFSGIFMGMANIFANSLVIQALVTLPASFVYPAYSASVMMVVVTVSSVIFREKLRRNEIAAVCCTIVGLILMNI
jgi:drug/metabolite transporter (DMT)-like permease